jgi:hypothetical protein
MGIQSIRADGLLQRRPGSPFVSIAYLCSATRTLEIHMNHKGSCHCGRVAFEVEGTIDGAVSCNCSMCQRKGSLLWFVPHDQLRLLTPDENASTYLFNKHLIKHRFCPTCGVHPYAEGTDPRGNRMAAINVRCLEGIDLTSVPVTHFDGRAM